MENKKTEVSTLPKIDNLYIRISPDAKEYLKQQAKRRDMALAEYFVMLVQEDELRMDKENIY